MFRGITALSLDTKGRMTLPTRHRETVHTESDNKVIVTIDIESKCLLIYLLADWEQIEKKLAALPSFNKAARRIQRLLIGHATEVELDAQGRVSLPAPLREYADLEKKAVLVGQGNKFELWSDEVWQRSRDQWLAEVEQDEDALPEDVMALSL